MKTASAQAWFFPTSPRSPYILQEELRLLKQFEGRFWDRETQYAFAERLAEHRNHAVSHFKDPPFTARDRVNRGPRMLGLIHLPKRGTRRPLIFTGAGNQLLTLEDPSYLYQRQLAKVQFASPLHDSRGFEKMRIRPMLAVIALLERLETLSKEELAVFVLTNTNYATLDECGERIERHRKELIEHAPGRDRKLYRRAATERRIKEVFVADISRGHIDIRESQSRGELATFLRIKYSNLKDYADATIRYLQASGLFTLSPLTQRLALSRAHLEDARYLIDNVGLAPVDYANMSYDDYIDGYLGNPDSPTIRKDDERFQTEDFKRIISTLTHNRVDTRSLEEAFESATSRNERLDALRGVEALLAASNVQEESRRIASARVATLEAIKQMYRDIAEKSGDIIDRPLMYEWNTWRALVLMNDALVVRGYFRVDVDGNPLTTAPGKSADIVIEYKSFWLLVEVTLQSGYKQYESEGESIVRHVGLFQKERTKSGDARPVYALFISDKINDTVVAYLQSQANFVQRIFCGSIKILPMDRSVFEKIVEVVIHSKNFTSDELRRHFDDIFAEDSLCQDSEKWVRGVSAWMDGALNTVS